MEYTPNSPIRSPRQLILIEEIEAFRNRYLRFVFINCKIHIENRIRLIRTSLLNFYIYSIYERHTLVEIHQMFEGIKSIKL